MTFLPKIEYNYYNFKPKVNSDSAGKKYQILEISSSAYKLKVDGKIFNCKPIAKFSLGWDPTILNLYRIAAIITTVACILATLTVAGWLVFFNNLLVVKALVVVAASSRFADYLEQQMKNKSFEIAAKVICTYENTDYLFEHSEYQL